MYKVVDNFCDEMDKARASVFAAGFGTWLPNKGEVGSSKYTGVGFWGEHSLLLRPLIGEHHQIVVPNTMFFKISNVGDETAYIHSDRESGNHTCIVYMSEHEEVSGTAFFRHKRTGMVRMPSMLEMLDMGILEEMKSDMVSRDPDKWEQLDFVRGLYNRALIFDAPLFHSRFPLEGISNDAESGRLIWGCHFHLIGSDGEFC